MNNLIDILRVGVFAPKPAPVLIWASESGLKYHIETAQSDAANGETFTALCGFTGLFQHQRNERHTFLRCFDCERIQAQSTTGILDVADQATGIAPVIDSLQVGDSGEVASPASPLQTSTSARGDAVTYQVALSPAVTRDCPNSGRDLTGNSSAASLPVPLGREGASSANGATWREAAKPEMVLHEMPVIQEMSQSTPAERYDLQSESEHRFGGKQEPVNVGGLTNTPLLTPADSQILPEPFTLQQTGATAFASLSVVPENFSCFIERIDEFVAARLPRIADCFCGRPSVHECPCGEPICANHSYDSLCGTCTEAKQLQQSSVMDGADRYEGAR